MYIVEAVLTVLFVTCFQVWVSDYDLSTLKSSFFQFFVVASPLFVCATIYLASELAALVKQSAATLESVQRNLKESHRQKEAKSAAEIKQHWDTIVREQSRVASLKKAGENLSRGIELKAEVITELKHKLKHGNKRVCDYSPAANIEDPVTLSEPHKDALEAARQEIADLKSALDLAVVPALPLATAATDPVAPSMGEHQRLLAEKTKLEKELQAEIRKSDRKDMELAAKDTAFAYQVTQKVNQVAKKIKDEQEEHARVLRLECDERVGQRQVDLDQKWDEEMARKEQQYDLAVKAVRSEIFTELNQNYDIQLAANVSNQVENRVATIQTSHQQTVHKLTTDHNDEINRHNNEITRLNDEITQLKQAATANESLNVSRHQGLAVEKLKKDHATEITRLKASQEAVNGTHRTDIITLDQDYNTAMSSLDIEKKKVDKLTGEVKEWKKDYEDVEKECTRLDTRATQLQSDLLAARAALPTSYLDPAAYDVPAFQRNALAAISPDYSKLPTVGLLACGGSMAYTPPPASRPAPRPATGPTLLRGPAAAPPIPVFSPTSVPTQRTKRGPTGAISKHDDDESDENEDDEAYEDDSDDEDGGEEAVGLSDGEEEFTIVNQVLK